MDTFSIHDAGTHPSKLVERAAKGERFVIAKAGKSMVKVVPIDPPAEKPMRRIDCPTGVYTISEASKAFGREEIEGTFYGPGG